jgi:hypothetical protein
MALICGRAVYTEEQLDYVLTSKKDNPNILSAVLLTDNFQFFVHAVTKKGWSFDQFHAAVHVAAIKNNLKALELLLDTCNEAHRTFFVQKYFMFIPCRQNSCFFFFFFC